MKNHRLTQQFSQKKNRKRLSTIMKCAFLFLLNTNIIWANQIYTQSEFLEPNLNHAELNAADISSTTLPVVQQQNNTPIKGIIVDESGEPIIGASIIEKGTANGIISDIDGNFLNNGRKWK